ncbi:MAG: alpha/beta hydrolase [Bacilli bacterium]
MNSFVKPGKNKNKKRGLIVLITFVISFLTLPFLAYPLSYPPSATAKVAYQNARQGQGYYAFENANTDIGFIYYPGGLVDPLAYASFAQSLAESLTINVYVVQPFLNLAITSIEAATPIMETHAEIETWMLGGHSLGGSSAAFYAIDHLTDIAGLIFLASYTTANADFSQTTLPILSITGSEDKVLNLETYEVAKAFLPNQTIYFDIPGGNHSQFGDYGFQRGDGEATISQEIQFALMIQVIQVWLLATIRS